MFRLTQGTLDSIMGGQVMFEDAPNAAARALLAVGVMKRIEQEFGYHAIRDVALVVGNAPAPLWRAMRELSQFRSREFTDEMLAEEASSGQEA